MHTYIQIARDSWLRETTKSRDASNSSHVKFSKSKTATAGSVVAAESSAALGMSAARGLQPNSLKELSHEIGSGHA